MTHGLTITESSDSTATVKAASLGDIGVIVTSTADTPEATAALDAAYPLNTPIMLTDPTAAAGKAGTGGTMKAVMTAIGQITSPVIIMVRVAPGETDAETTANVIGTSDGVRFTGLQALMAAFATVGRRPRILGAPGLDTQEVTAALVIAAKKLRARAYARALGDTVAEVTTYRALFSARELTLIDNDTSATFAGEAIARALAVRALIDATIGYQKTISMVALDGVLGLTKDRHFDLLDPTTDAGLLNDADVVTLVRVPAGFVFWGNTTCAEEGSAYAFESSVWTLYALQDIIIAQFGPYFDSPITEGMVKHLLELVNAACTAEKTAGRLMGAKISLAAGNTSAELAAGRPKFKIAFTPCAPMNNPSVDFDITDEGYDGFADSIAS
jgi:phage tail sheath protein FI